MYLSVQLSWDQERRRYDWHTTRMLLLPFARQTYVCWTIIVRQNSEVNRKTELGSTVTTSIARTCTCTWHLRLAGHKSLLHNFDATITHGPTIGKNRSTRTITKQPVVTVALHLLFFFIDVSRISFFSCSHIIRQNVPFMCFQCMFFLDFVLQ